MQSLQGALARAEVEERAERAPSLRTTRRQALAGAAAAAASATFVGRAMAAPAPGGTPPRTVVVGAGLAGLTAAYRLKQNGVTAQLYEASDRIGGRCWSGRLGGQIYEHGGELIDTGHTQVKQLAQSLGLTLDNLHQAEQNGTEPMNWFDGAPYTYAQATDDLKGIWQKIHSDLSAASYPTLYTGYTQRGYELDHMSVIDWINESVPGGVKSKLGQLLDVAYNIEYGAESKVQSSLNLLYLLGYSGQGQLRIFGPSNEKYHVNGGNDQIPAALAGQLGGQITLGSSLVAIARASNGSYTLTFSQGGTTKQVAADQVVLALPFSIMRSSVDFSKAGFNAIKTTAIREQGMGTNSKLHAQFSSRHWRTLGCNGDTYADTGYQSTWEVTRAQPGTAGILVDYTGGTIGASFGSGTPVSRAQQFCAQIEPLLPGISQKFNGNATVDYWAANPYTKGSYSYWKVGQYTKFSGAERERSGNVHFAGEHTSIDFQGYLNGAVESGERAAAEILADLK
jgi:monoamine oxidase